MNDIAIPPLISAGIMIYVGFSHLLLYVRRRSHREDLAFAAVGVTAGLYAICAAGLYDVDSVAEGVVWQRWQVSAMALFSITFLWFIHEYTHSKTEPLLYGLAGFYLASIPVQLLSRKASTWDVNTPAIKEIPWLNVTYYEASAGWYTTLMAASILLAGLYVFRRVFHYHRQTQPGKSYLLVSVLVLFFAAAANDMLVSWGVYPFIYLLEYGFIVLVIFMTYSLSSILMAAETRLRRSEEKFNKAFHTSPDAVNINRLTDGLYLDINDGFTQLTGYTWEDIQGKTSAETQIWVDLNDRARLVQGLRETGEVNNLEAEFRKKDGSVSTGLMSARIIEIDGELCILSITRNISERKQAEREREALITELEFKNAELERFTYTVSHDLKSPLITIQGFLGYLEPAALEGNIEQLRSDMGRIRGAVEKMERLLDELLELSRIGRLVNAPEAVPLEALAREAVETAQGILDQHNVVVEIAPDLPTAYGDRVRLREVFENLVHNAAKFMGNQAAPRIVIGTRQDGEGCVCYVQDNGIGIDPQYAERVFGLFNKLDPKTEGTGIGLTITRRIIEVHGGRIWVESAGEGQGSTFCFTLPRKPHPDREHST